MDWVTLLPMGWLVVITMTASIRKSSAPTPASDFGSGERVGRADCSRESCGVENCGYAPEHFQFALDAVVTAVLAAMILVLPWRRWRSGTPF